MLSYNSTYTNSVVFVLSCVEKKCNVPQQSFNMVSGSSKNVCCFRVVLSAGNKIHSHRVTPTKKISHVVFDVLPYMQRNHKLSLYTLNSVSSEFLEQQKEDVRHSIISTLQNGSDEDIHRLAVYCLKDALLPQRLMDKLSVIMNYVEMTRVSDII